MRSFALILLLIVVFLAGILIGIDKDGKAEPYQIPMTDLPEMHYPEDIIVENQISEVTLIGNEIDSSNHLTQKAASFIETGVTGFYDIVVEILYQIASVVFN